MLKGNGGSQSQTMVATATPNNQHIEATSMVVMRGRPARQAGSCCVVAAVAQLWQGSDPRRSCNSAAVAKAYRV